MNPLALKAAIEKVSKDAGKSFSNSLQFRWTFYKGVEIPVVAAITGDDLLDKAAEFRFVEK